MAETCSVLVVEDDAAIRVMLADGLNEEGFAVWSAANGRDALAALEQWRPDVILLDLNMPVMDGWSFHDELRRRPRLAGIPVIVLTAARRDARTNGLGAVEVIPKPCDLGALTSAIRAAISSPDGRRLDGARSRTEQR